MRDKKMGQFLRILVRVKRTRRRMTRRQVASLAAALAMSWPATWAAGEVWTMEIGDTTTHTQDGRSHPDCYAVGNDERGVMICADGFIQFDRW